MKRTSLLAALAATVLFCAANLAQAQEAATPPTAAEIQERIDAKQALLDDLDGKRPKKKMARADRIEAMVDLLKLRKAKAEQDEAGTTLTDKEILERREAIMEARIAQIDAALVAVKFRKPYVAEVNALNREKVDVLTRLTAVKAKIASMP